MSQDFSIYFDKVLAGDVDAGDSSGQATRTGCRPADLPWAIAVLPAALVYPTVLMLLMLHRPAYDFMIAKERGLDAYTPIVLLIGLGFGVWALAQAGRLPPVAKWIRKWVLFVMLCMVFLAGEEVSWGQHLGFWSSEDLPAWFKRLTDQGETNLHNLIVGGNALEQGFKNIFFLATLVGCLILPAWRRRKNRVLPVAGAAYWFWPTPACFAAAIGVIWIMWPNRIAEWVTGEKLVALRHSEMFEFYVALLMMVYLASIAWRLKNMPAKTGQG